jgi:hypothetical protein
MTTPRLWERCINHRGAEAQQFIADYFGDERRRALLITGAGFDPRSAVVCEMLAEVMGERVNALFIREERPNPAQELVRRAESNCGRMRACVPRFQEVEVEIVAADGAVTGGRNAVRAVGGVHLEDVTDTIVDLSALSIGVAFPIVRQLFDHTRELAGGLNLHLMVTDEPSTDQRIDMTASDTAEMVHGFRGGMGLYDNVDAAKLWLPQLIKGRGAVLEKIYTYLGPPHDVCPILPFPAEHPRQPDDIAEHYIEMLEGVWEVDPRNIIYADERKPLDLYRTILRIDDARRRVFAGVGGSKTILSPIGSKVLAVGALMAAMERDFPVAYVEAIAYNTDFDALDGVRHEAGDVVHVWLCGEAYPEQSPLGFREKRSLG